MKLKTLSIVASAIALTLTATPFLVKAQTGSPSPQPGVETPKKPRGERGPWKNLNLTEAQKTRIQEINRNTRTQIEAVFTDEQKAKLKAAFQARQAQRAQGQQRPQGQRPGKEFADLNLSEAQKTQIRQIRESSKQQMQSVLTAEQQQKLQEFKKNAASRRQPATR
ncbi:Spy/CpxP family protein refolding chaperone [Calothrix sp. PCC 7507]|uniref:Spy/CpxP family protein refolding chaperone n=1 Tax=Calothrix sp. PCC 7507 TaxID=99598 RepID=UPI000300B23D|nr:pilus assembly protein [Calothrix sp. PCC 7507]